ncbi:hypothetical protein AB0J35_51090 [Nonomuraea angiospora]|uniref:hypothetical protein n=1 Tax=Nonomuraea angiospora TaxID=46172 RepID=UPI00343763D9
MTFHDRRVTVVIVARDEDADRRILPGGREQVTTYHGPVEHEKRLEDVVVFTGGEESDLLHAAGAWIAARPYTTLLGINFIADEHCPSSERHPSEAGGAPVHRLAITVSRIDMPRPSRPAE